MAHLRAARQSERREYEHPAGAPVMIHELVDAEKMIFLAELAIPNVALVGEHEFEVLELPASAIEFDAEDAREFGPSDEEALRNAASWLGADVTLHDKDRLPPRTLEVAA